MDIDESDYLAHYGILRKSGRYPWGSGGPETNTGNKGFLDYVAELKSKGLTETQIAEGMGINTSALRAAKSIAKNEQKQEDINMAQRLKDKGLSNSAIGRRMNRNESSVRALLAPGVKDKNDILTTVSNRLREEIDKKQYLDVGAGTEHYIGISREKLNTAIAILKQEGYKMHYLKEPQPGTGNFTTLKVLSKPDVPFSEVYKNRGSIKQFTDYSEDGGRTLLGIQKPLSIDSSRVKVRYDEEGGSKEDGVIYVRPGVSDVNIGGSQYAQVRIAVNGTHYLKGMAMYKNDLPDGIDLVFNTNKSDTGNKLDAMKPLKDDPDNPFGAVIKRQILHKDENGKEHNTSVMNIVNEEGDWDKWSRSLSSQTLSKQSPALAKTQLDMTYESRKRTLDEIMALNNPAVRKKLLQSYSDDVDAAAVHLKAAAIPRSSWHVILPFNSIKSDEIYAPNFENGTRVALIRYPHGGKFEIPELTVNNRRPEPKSVIGQAKDAVGINHKVAERLSGADFDGDAVLVIPNDRGAIKSAPALEGLKGFDPKASHPPYDGMRTIDGGIYNASTKSVDYGGKNPVGSTKQTEMGKITNLIADMTIRNASSDELARAVRHSMVVIDAEKHVLDYKGSARQNGIPQLKQKYQGKSTAGASTLITRAGSEVYVPKRDPRSAKEGGPIDRATGKKVYSDKVETFVGKDGKVVIKRQKIERLANTDDAFTLSSGTPIEKIYAEHSNRLKALANTARKEMIETPNIVQSKSAKAAYSREVATLEAKLKLAQRNAPLERQAILLANAVVSIKKQANPDMEPEVEKKIRSQALTEMRLRTGAKKQRIDITPTEWDAIQAGAISNNKLNQILSNTNIELVKKLATPKTQTVLPDSRLSRARAMLAAGRTQAEVANALGVSLTTLKTSIGG